MVKIYFWKVFTLISLPIFLDTAQASFDWGSGDKSCELTCKDEQLQSINDYFASQEFEAQITECEDRTITSLVLRNMQSDVTKFKLEEHWLKYNNHNENDKIGITSLTIMNSQIVDILIGAFLGDLFANLKVLILNKFSSGDFKFRSGQLNGLYQLQSLEIKRIQISDFDPDFLEPVENTLIKIKIEESVNEIKSSTLKNLFSGSELGAGSEIELRSNYIRNIEKDTFANQKLLNTLTILYNIGELVMDKEMLYPLTSLRTFNIRNNNLTTLPNGLFVKHVNINDFRVLTLGNKWNCDCELKHLVDADRNASNSGNAKIFEDDIICTAPLNYQGQSLIYDMIDVCPETPEPEPEEDLVELKCTSQFGAKESTISVPDKKIQFHIDEISGESVYINITNKAGKENLTLIWFDNKNISTETKLIQANSNISCTSEIHSLLRVDNMEPDLIYTFCVSQIDDEKFSFTPFHCITYFTGDKENSSNNNQSKNDGVINFNLAIALLITIPLLTFILGAIGMYCYVRSKLIKGQILEHERRMSQYQRDNDKRLSSRALPDIASVKSEHEEIQNRSRRESKLSSHMEEENDLYLPPLPPPYWNNEEIQNDVNIQRNSAKTPTTYMEFPNADSDNIYEYIDQEQRNIYLIDTAQ